MLDQTTQPQGIVGEENDNVGDATYRVTANELRHIENRIEVEATEIRALRQYFRQIMVRCVRRMRRERGLQS